MADQPPDELAVVRQRRAPGVKKGRKPGSPAGPESGAKEIEAKRRQADAIKLRVTGATLQQIADSLGYATPSGAHQAIMAGLREILPEQLRADGRRLELAKLDRLEMANWPKALAGDEKAAAVILRCVDTRVKINGLAAPVQVDMRVRDGEMVRVEVLDLLTDETMAALEVLQDEMVNWSDLRAGAIDVDATDLG